MGHISAEVLNAGVSDHSPLLVQCGTRAPSPKQQFKFLNCIAEHSNFLPIVAHHWSMQVTGVPMFIVWCKLKALKGPMKSLIHHYSHVDCKIESSRA